MTAVTPTVHRDPAEKVVVAEGVIIVGKRRGMIRFVVQKIDRPGESPQVLPFITRWFSSDAVITPAKGTVGNHLIPQQVGMINRAVEAQANGRADKEVLVTDRGAGLGVGRLVEDSLGIKPRTGLSNVKREPIRFGVEWSVTRLARGGEYEKNKGSGKQPAPHPIEQKVTKRTKAGTPDQRSATWSAGFILQSIEMA